ncbi:hypothetical protein AVU69_gp22 [Clostridium phage phiCDHM11]|jgi:hypothetical protein|uniref:Uncharacterized protein n=3 Tax=Sherbrookevirus TaxID=2843455 RepID=A0A0K2SUB6_9CAUD|nr:hypothetical protein [Clostridioides difficile]YP_009217657.1 hypothetical protein AVU69_gp22 [Clostridium phage phiCDHM11]YP_009226594.1 hypothetical protein AXI87_gp22 [Clostridium phage phiCDHM13]YP_009833541.1 hypothetical protein HWB20_gp22 [Clostridium phage phiCDHM14]MBS8554761.1 hypothetical protein [Escherichia coli]HDN2469792.1 hypothetical protein [Clostridioides difficile CD196]EGT3704832.1 hypothetical protein [Clostridioides difficile]EGT3860519.1 hypothetical protein [Clost
MNINNVVVRILAERILNKGLNPLKNRPFELDDVTNTEYRKAVEDYIIKESGVVEGAEPTA